MRYANLTSAILYGTNLSSTDRLNQSTGSLFYYTNTILPTDFNPVTLGWKLTSYCDFSADGACDSDDIEQIFNIGDLGTGVGTSVTTERFDLVDNAVIDAADITEWLSQAATANGHSSPYLRGDTDLDHDVDTVDLTRAIMNYNGATGSGGIWSTGDTDGDGDTDTVDLTRAIMNFTGASNTAAAVPEPSGLILLVLAAGCLAVGRGRSCRR